jgi:hypothetical protein
MLPRHRSRSEPGFEDDRRRALPHAIDVKDTPADVDQAPRCGVTTVRHVADDQLIDRSDDEYEDDQRNQADDDPADHAEHSARARCAASWLHGRSGGGHFAVQTKFDASFVSPDPL